MRMCMSIPIPISHSDVQVFSVIVWIISTILFTLIISAVLKSVKRVKSSVGSDSTTSFIGEILKTIKASSEIGYCF